MTKAKITRGDIVNRANGRGRGVVLYTEIYGRSDLVTVRWSSSTIGPYQGSDLEHTINLKPAT